MADDDRKVIAAGKARSRKEALAAAMGGKCANCGSFEVFQWEEEAPPEGSDWVIAFQTYCEDCGARWLRQYQAGPGWEDQPDEDEPRFARATQPSTLLPERVFREWMEQLVDELRDLEPPPEGADADDLQGHRDEKFALAKDGLDSLLEIEKFMRAEGRPADPELATLKQWLAECFVEAGGTLPE